MNVFIGRVAENRFYSKTGYIDVVAFQLSYENGFSRHLRKEFNLEDIINDIIPSYDEGLRADGMNICKCRVLSPLGAGNNYGMFTLPQVNSVGLILELDDANAQYWTSNDRYIWLGGLYGGKMHNEVMTLPCDDTESELLEHEENVYTDENEREGTEDTILESPYREEGMFLVKLKTSKTGTDPDNERDKQHIHYDTIPCDNEFVMRKTRTTLRYNTYDDDDQRLGITDLTFEKPRLQLSRFTAREHSEDKDDIREEQIEVFDDEKIKLQFLNKKTKVDRWLQIDNDMMEMQFDDPEGKKNHIIHFNNTNHEMNIDFKDDDTQIERQIKWDDNDLTVKFDNYGGSQFVTMSFDKDGTVTVHATKDCKINIDKASEVKIGTNSKVSIGGNSEVKVSGNSKIETTGTTDIISTGPSTLESKASCTVKGMTVDVDAQTMCTVKGAMVKITGGTLMTNGMAPPTGSGPFCALPMCPIIKIPHSGNIVMGT